MQGIEPPVIDLNCDMGEGMDNDAAIFQFISSVNIACGFHAGDKDTMRRTVELALLHRVAIGAHPSYPDRENFGRIDLLDFSQEEKREPRPPGARLQPEELPGIITTQLQLLQNICTEFGAKLHHVKPHGALYNRAARDASISALICQAVKEFDPSLYLYGLSGSITQTAAEHYGLSFVHEVFADRTYREDGSLTPRNEAHSLIDDPRLALHQVLKLIREGKVKTGSGKEIPLIAETICIHGDGPHALEFAGVLYRSLKEEGLDIRQPSIGF
jgi:UPF0271 protein